VPDDLAMQRLAAVHPAMKAALPRAVRRRRSTGAIWLLLPSLVLLAAFTYWPVAQVVWRSLLQQQFGDGVSYGLGNYARLLSDRGFGQAAGNTALFALGTIVPSIVLALLFALALQDQTWLHGVLRCMLVMPMMVPLVAAAALFTFLMLPGEGLIDHYLAAIGLGATNWLGDPALALGSICAITVWKNAGYYMLFFLAGLAGVPRELHEAAMLEGANALQRAWRITLPLLGPTFAFVLVIAAVNVLVQVDHVIVMTGGGPSGTTNLLLSYIYQQSQQNTDPGLASAATAVSVAGLFALAVVGLRTLERGVHYES
jgi:sn-glycerol 3-phosphate transport system permease protein